MGAALPAIISGLKCDSCAKYVCNGMDIESECFDDWCHCKYHTEATPISQDPTYDVQVDMQGLHVVKN
jgi:hypothetical protein